VRVILYNQQNRVARLNVHPVVGNRLDRPFRQTGTVQSGERRQL